MNRAERRRLAKNQSKRGIAATPDASGTLQRDLRIGVGHHRAGRLAEAAELYSAILEQQPDHADANNLLGLVAYQNGDHENAVALISKAIAVNPHSPAYHNNKGNPLKRLGRLDEAAACYGKAIALEPDYAEAHFNLGNVLREQWRREAAVASFGEALAIRPDYVEAHLNLGISLRALGRFSEAIASFNKTLSLRPDYAEAHHSLGLAFHESGETDKAVASLRNAVGLMPQNDEIWGDLAEIMSNLSFTLVDDGLFEDLHSMLGRSSVRPNRVSRAIISALRHQPDFASLVAAADEAYDDYDEAAGRLSNIPLLLRLMGLCVLNDVACERMMTGLRRAMIRTEATGKEDARSLPFTAALAVQCFTNEYAYFETADESAAVEALGQRLGRLAEGGEDIAPHSLAAVAAYRPLHGFPWAERLVARTWPEPLMAVIERQLREPYVERTLRDRIASLTPIEDMVSQGVREQYEENPYPRWIKVGLSVKAIPIDQYIRATVLNLDLGDYVSPESPEILIAGCGTGQHALTTATRYRNARVLAVDLSRASLAYALRKTRELGIDNIEYSHGDILELGGLGRQFDLIECAGVLHHMDDPLAGWRVLADLLRPGGLMYIGLYSEAARRPVVTVREMIAEKGYAGRAEDIRRCRRDIMDAVRAGDRELERLVIWGDFYSLSGCRDLLFHVQEHRFTIPMIEDALGRLDLTFLGFSLSGNLAAHLEVMPTRGEGSAHATLSRWRDFEIENPNAFAGMYQFWVRKPG